MNAEQEVIQFFEHLGVKITKIEEGEGKTPDFFVECKDASYLIELKEKFTDQNYLKAREKTLLRGEIFEEFLPTGRKNRISQVIRSAVKQLSFANVKADFKLVWLYAKGHHPDFQIYDFESALYGCEVIVDWGKEGGFSGYCYYYGNSEFFNHKENLDGAIISDSEELKFCLNTCSNKYKKLKNSELCILLKDGVLDPKILEEKGSALLVESDVDRSNERAVMEHIVKKYALNRAMRMPMQQMAGTIALPEE